EYKAALEHQQFVLARLGQLQQRLSKLSQVDVSQIPMDRAGLGSRGEGEALHTGNTDTYTLVRVDSEDFDDRHASIASPIGRALVGKAVGEGVVLKLPGRTRRLKITRLGTIHETVAE